MVGDERVPGFGDPTALLGARGRRVAEEFFCPRSWGAQEAGAHLEFPLSAGKSMNFHQVRRAFLRGCSAGAAGQQPCHRRPLLGEAVWKRR